MSAINSDIIKTNAIISPTTSLALVNSATTTLINVGGAGTIVLAHNVVTPTVKQKVYYFSTQTLSPTVANFLANGTIVISLFSSANPSTINDIITMNLPPPTAELDGCFFLFRKLRGQLNNSSTNWTFVTSPASLLSGGASLTSGATPVVSTLSFNPGVQRLFVISYAGSYYWTFA